MMLETGRNNMPDTRLERDTQPAKEERGNDSSQGFDEDWVAGFLEGWVHAGLMHEDHKSGLMLKADAMVRGARNGIQNNAKRYSDWSDGDYVA